MMPVLLRVRDYLHQGHQLISHPLSGSLKPNENPYKSIMITRGRGELNIKQVMIIENAIETCKKFLNNKSLPNYTDDLLNDFMYVDKTIITSGLKN